MLHCSLHNTAPVSVTQYQNMMKHKLARAKACAQHQFAIKQNTTLIRGRSCDVEMHARPAAKFIFMTDVVQTEVKVRKALACKVLDAIMVVVLLLVICSTARRLFHTVCGVCGLPPF